MNVAPSAFLTVLQSRARDFVTCVEFYESSYVPNTILGFEPPEAIGAFSTVALTFTLGTLDPVTYERLALEMPDLRRGIGKQANSVTVNFSNVTHAHASFVLNNVVAGMRMVIRLVSRSANSSFILFVGRCDKPNGFDRKDGSITAKQDLGQIEAQIPPHIFQRDCPIKFKGTLCLGTELLSEKSATYQAALTCNKSYDQCLQYENEEFTLGIKTAQTEGSFIHKPHVGIWTKVAKIVFPLPGALLLRRKSITVGSSLEDGTPYGQARPIVLGRWQMPGIPLQFQDIGTGINFLMAFCDGPIAYIRNIRCDNVGFSQPQGIVKHGGYFGGEPTQLADTVFPEGGFFSKLAYITGYVTGSDIAVEDPAPSISAMIGGLMVQNPFSFGMWGTGRMSDGESTGAHYSSAFAFGWTDNPVDLVKLLLTDAAFLGNGSSFIDNFTTIITSIYCSGTVQDLSNAERLLLPDTETGKAGVDYFRYYSTGLISSESWPITLIQKPVGVVDRQAKYEFFDPDAPPTTTAVKTLYRKRYTCNVAITERQKTIDFLFDVLLPTFRGYLSWNWLGKVGVRCERPSDSILIRGAAVAGDTTIQVEDILPWRIPLEFVSSTRGKILIGVSLTTSEVRSVTGSAYTTAANSITLAASATGGPTATASDVTFSGGTTSAPAEATVTLGGSFTEDAVITITIDGIDCVYTLLDGADGREAAFGMCVAVNSNPTVSRYVEAVNYDDLLVRLRSKMGSLTLSSALAEDHDIGEETIRVMMAFSGKALTYADTTKANTIDGSFKYLGSNGQARYNQAKGTYIEAIRDFASQPYIVHDYEDQERVNKIIPYEIDLRAVDNYHQARRLLNGALAKYGDGNDFFSWGSAGEALQLEEGDVVCVNDDSGEWRNVPVRVEELRVNSKFEVAFTARVYATSMFDDTVEQTTVPLPSALTGWDGAPPEIEFNAVDFAPDGLAQSTDGVGGITSIRGGAIFSPYVYGQIAHVSVKRPLSAVFVPVTDIKPDSNLEAIFEIIASTPGPYTFELEVCSLTSGVCNTTKPTATIVVGLGVAQGAWTTPMLALSGAGDVQTTAAGTYTIPMITETGAGEPQPTGGGNFDIP